MAESLSVIASVIAVTQLTYSSCKALNDKIKGIKHTPSYFNDLQASLDAFQNVIEPFERDIAGRKDATLSADQQQSMQGLQQVMVCCKTALTKFTERLAEMTSHSDENHIGWRDRIGLDFNKGEIRALKEDLANGQRALSDALGFVNLQATSQNAEALDKFASTCASTLSEITGQLSGIERTVETLRIPTMNIPGQEVKDAFKTLEELKTMLLASLQVYGPATREVSKWSGTSVKYQRTFDRAKVLTGNVDFHGNSSAISVETSEARDDSLIFTGNISGDALRTLLNHKPNKA